MIGEELVFWYVVSAAHILAVSATHFLYTKCRNDKYNPIQYTKACNFQAKKPHVQAWLSWSEQGTVNP